MESSDPRRAQHRDNEEEEEEEDYTPVVRPHRYIYKYHRVGTKSLDKIAGPATTPSIDQQQPTVHEISSTASHSSSHVTTKSETVTRQTVVTESKFESSAVSGITSTDISQPLISSSAAPLETTHSSEGFAITDSTAHREGNLEGQPKQTTDVAEHIQAKEVLSKETATAPALGTMETHEISDVSQNAETQEVISAITEEGHSVVAGLTTGTPQAIGAEVDEHSVQKVINGLTQEGHEVINGLSSQAHKHEQLGESGIAPPVGLGKDEAVSHEVISGLTATEQSIVAGIMLHSGTEGSSATNEEQPCADLSTVTPTNGSAPDKTDTTSSIEIISGISADNAKILAGLSTLEAEHHSLQASEILAKTSPITSEVSMSGNVQEIISGVTGDKIEMISGLSTVPSTQEVDVNQTTGISPIGIISGLTADGTCIVCGLMSNVHQDFATSTSAVTLESHESVPPTQMETSAISEAAHEKEMTTIVGGLTEGGTEIVAGLAADDTKLPGHFETHISKDSIHDGALAVIVGGLTSDGIGIISGLALRHDAEPHSAECSASNIESVSGANESDVHIVSGIASEGEKIISGVADDIPAEQQCHSEVTIDFSGSFDKQSEIVHTETPSVQLHEAQQDQSADNLHQSNLVSDSGQQPVQQYNLPPEDVPARSDSF